MSIEILKGEHVELRRIADELGQLIAGAAPCDSATLAACRWKLARLVTRHLACEDREIYNRPHDPASPLGANAARLKDEMGDLYAAFHRHITSWPGEAVARDWDGYRAETLGLLKALRDRIEREERDLYPLVEEAAARIAAKAAKAA